MMFRLHAKKSTRGMAVGTGHRLPRPRGGRSGLQESTYDSHGAPALRNLYEVATASSFPSFLPYPNLNLTVQG